MQPQCISTIRKQSNLNTVTARHDRIWWLIILFQPNIFKNMWVSTTIIDHPWWHHSKSFRLMLQPPCKCWPSHFFCIFTLFLELLSLLCDAYITCRAGLDISRTCEKGNTMECIYIYISVWFCKSSKNIYLYIYIYSHDTLISAAVCYLAKHAHIGPGFGNKVCLLKHDLLQCGTAYAQICASHVLVRCSFFFCSSSKRLFFSFQCQATSFRNNHLWTPSPHSHSPCLQHTNQPPLFKVFHHVLLKATMHSDGCRTHASTPPEILPVQNCVHLRHFQLPTYVCSFLSIMCLWAWQCARAFSWNLPQNQETFQ